MENQLLRTWEKLQNTYFTENGVLQCYLVRVLFFIFIYVDQYSSAMIASSEDTKIVTKEFMLCCSYVEILNDELYTRYFRVNCLRPLFSNFMEHLLP